MTGPDAVEAVLNGQIANLGEFAAGFGDLVRGDALFGGGLLRRFWACKHGLGASKPISLLGDQAFLRQRGDTIGIDGRASGFLIFRQGRREEGIAHGLRNGTHPGPGLRGPACQFRESRHVEGATEALVGAEVG